MLFLDVVIINSRKMKRILIFCLALYFGSAMSAKVFWRDKKLGAFALDALFSSEVLEKFTSYVAGEDYPMAFNGDSEEYVSKLSVLSGFKTKRTRAHSSKTVIGLAKCVRKLYPKLGVVHVSHSEGVIIERSDFNPTATACAGKESKVLGIIMLNTQWKKNDYGEVGLIDDNEEIVMSFHPKPGRIIFMKCGTKYKVSSPALEKRLRFAFIEFGMSKEIEEQPNQILFTDLIMNMPHLNKFEEKEISEYVTKVFKSKDKKKIYVFDNLFPDELVRVFYDYIVNNISYTEQEIDYEGDNVRWILGLDDPNFENGPVWGLIRQALAYVSGSKTFTPYDIACNHIRRADNTVIHKDCGDNETEYTNLLYLNPKWSPDHHGETIFLDGVGDYLAAVVPKFGRLLIFDSTIEHSARPSSPNIHGKNNKS